MINPSIIGIKINDWLFFQYCWDTTTIPTTTTECPTPADCPPCTTPEASTCEPCPVCTTDGCPVCTTETPLTTAAPPCDNTSLCMNNGSCKDLLEGGHLCVCKDGKGQWTIDFHAPLYFVLKGVVSKNLPKPYICDRRGYNSWSDGAYHVNTLGPTNTQGHS